MEKPTASSGIRKLLILSGLGFVLLNACQGAPATINVSSQTLPSPTKPTLSASVTITPRPTYQPYAPIIPTLTPYPIDGCEGPRYCLRWFVGLGIGSYPSQAKVKEEVVSDFHLSQDTIVLLLELVPHNYAHDILSIEMKSGNPPDVVGPMKWTDTHDFSGQWLDLTPYIRSSGFDILIFDPALVKAYQTKEGLVGLPLTVYPSGMFFVPALFDKAGLSYPPQKYGDKYEMPDGTLVDWNWDTVEAIAKLLTLDKNGKNSTEAGFDRTQIVQVGYVPQWQHPNLIGAYDGGASKIYIGDKKGNYQAAIPDLWKKAWQRHYDAMWGAQPWMPTGLLAATLDVGGGNRNVFASGQAAMALTQTSYTCCLGAFVHASHQFQVGIIPMSADGQVHGRVSADTFRIWKDTHYPEGAFQVLTYLITTGGDKLLPIYDAMPAIESKTDTFFKKKSEQFPFVTQASWEVFKAGVAYPDVPSVDGYLPNFTEADARIQAFGDLMDDTPPDQFDFESEFKKLEDDLTIIFNK